MRINNTYRFVYGNPYGGTDATGMDPDLLRWYDVIPGIGPFIGLGSAYAELKAVNREASNWICSWSTKGFNSRPACFTLWANNLTKLSPLETVPYNLLLV